MLPPLERLRNGTAAARRDGLAGRGLFFAAHNVSNVLNYAFLLLMSRALPSGDFALFAALFGAAYLASALANTAQTSIAAIVAGADGPAAEAVVAGATRHLVTVALPFALAVAIAARPVASFLHSDDTVSVGLTGAAIWLTLLAAVGYGALQGSGRFGLLGAGLIVAAAGRLALGGVLVWWGYGVAGALLGIVLGMGLSAGLVLAPFGRAVFRRPNLPSLVRPPVLAALLTSVAIATPTSADVLLARHYFSAEAAGAYAAVSVLGKVTIFAPMAVSLIVFPRFVQHAASRAPSGPLLRLSLLATAIIAVPLAVVALAAGALAPDTVLRGHDVSPAFLATYLGAMLTFSFAVTLLYVQLARRQERFVIGACVALGLELAAITLWHPNAIGVAAVLLVGNGLLLGSGLWLSVRPLAADRKAGQRGWTAAPAHKLQAEEV